MIIKIIMAMAMNFKGQCGATIEYMLYQTKKICEGFTCLRYRWIFSVLYYFSGICFVTRVLEETWRISLVYFGRNKIGKLSTVFEIRDSFATHICFICLRLD